jgi:hypothetical protein
LRPETRNRRGQCTKDTHGLLPIPAPPSGRANALACAGGCKPGARDENQ